MSKLKAQLLILTLVVIASSCVNPPQIIKGVTMGTSYTINLSRHHLDTTKLNDLTKIINKKLVEINDVMSTYIKDSELNRLNDWPVNRWFVASKALFNIIKLSDKISQKTNGYFDITVGKAVNHWGFGPEGLKPLASQPQSRNLKRFIGYRFLKLDHLRKRIKKTRPGLYIDLSAIAKGFGVDQISDLLLAYQIDNHMVEIGGEIKVKGSNASEKKWRLAIEKPSLGHSVLKVIEVTNQAMATSGSYRNFREYKDNLISHTINPKTGQAIYRNLVSVTVIDKNCAKADAFATALMAMGYKRAIKLANKQKIPAYFLVRQDKKTIERKSLTFDY